jgi:peptide deformylase
MSKPETTEITKLANWETLEFLQKEDLKNVNIHDPNRAEELMSLAGHMFQYCVNNNGEALSACQIGIKERFFVMRTTKDQYAIVVNPTYFKNGSRYQILEGCLSYPGRAFRVKRYRRIKVQFWTIHDGNFIYQTESMTGYPAEIFQHETDHCNAKTIAQIGTEVR